MSVSIIVFPFLKTRVEEEVSVKCTLGATRQMTAIKMNKKKEDNKKQLGHKKRHNVKTLKEQPSYERDFHNNAHQLSYMKIFLHTYSIPSYIVLLLTLYSLLS